MRVLVTGATGYIGSRLVPELVKAGHEVVVGARDTGKIEAYPWSTDVEAREFDVTDAGVVRRAVRGIDAVIYLIHSMGGDDFVTHDREAAHAVAAACDDEGVARVVYLSGLVPDTDDLSDHLASRLEVEEILLEASTPAIVLRAAMVIGAGSTSYELLNRLTARVPVTPVPTWMRRRVQPVAVEDVILTIREALESDDSTLDRHYDLGGDRVIAYPDLIATMARLQGHRRPQVVIPFVPQWVVGRMAALIAGMSMTETTSLIESLRHDMVCSEDAVRRELLPADHEFVELEESLRRAMAPTEEGTEATGDPLASAPTD